MYDIAKYIRIDSLTFRGHTFRNRTVIYCSSLHIFMAGRDCSIDPVSHSSPNASHDARGSSVVCAVVTWLERHNDVLDGSVPAAQDGIIPLCVLTLFAAILAVTETTGFYNWHKRIMSGGC